MDAGQVGDRVRRVGDPQPKAGLVQAAAGAGRRGERAELGAVAGDHEPQVPGRGAVAEPAIYPRLG